MGEKLKILILGGGVSAAFINAACLHSGAQPEILSQASPTTPSGCFWIHKIPTHLRSKALFPEKIHIMSTGNSADYILKQWGKNDSGTWSSSFPEKPRYEFGYALPKVLETLWGQSRISLCGRLEERRIAELAKKFDLVFRTFPTGEMIARRAQYLVRIPIVSYTLSSPISNFVVYNGQIDETLVRMSALFNTIQYEFLAGTIIPQHHLAGTFTTVNDLHPDIPAIRPDENTLSNVYFIGRYAQFRKCLLTHDAYQATLDILEKHT